MPFYPMVVACGLLGFAVGDAGGHDGSLKFELRRERCVGFAVCGVLHPLAVEVLYFAHASGSLSLLQ